MFVSITDFAKSDTVFDTAANTLRPNIITAGKNYKLSDGKIGSRRGSSEFYGAAGIVPYWITSGLQGSTPYWLYAGLTKVYLLMSGASSNVTRQTAGVDVDYTATVNTPWTGGGFNGISVLNNGNDVPQMFLSTGSLCADMTNWPSTLRCKSLRPFKNFLIACNVTESGTEYPQVLRWSHPADPGAVPSSWDYTATTVDAGRKALAETKGVLVDSLAAQDVHIVYKNDSTYYMQYIGAPFIFNFQPISLTSGLLSQNCAANVPGGQVALTYDDVVFVTPRGVTSIATKRIRRALFAAINFDQKRYAFVAVNSALSEVWVCVPVNSTYASRAYVYNWLEDKWSIRDIPALTSLAQGYDVSSSDTWTSAAGTWATDSDPWGAYDLSGAQFLGVSPNGSGKLLVMETGGLENGAPISVVVTHDAIDTFQELQISNERMKYINRVRPHFTPESAGAVVMFEIGMRNTLSDAVNWTTEKTFTVGITRDVFVRKQGRYMSWRIKSACETPWELSGMEIEVEVGGRF